MPKRKPKKGGSLLLYPLLCMHCLKPGPEGGIKDACPHCGKLQVMNPQHEGG